MKLKLKLLVMEPLVRAVFLVVAPENARTSLKILTIEVARN
ncbi:hypothetical protein LINPERHAP1_LOCUS31959 [Linum perenne]